MRSAIVILTLLFAGCQSAVPVVRSAAMPPWRQPPLAAADVPRVYLEQWRKAENRDRCALIAPRVAGGSADAAPRAASFSGGWAVAYDTPQQRSAFGIAGTGVAPDGTTYSKWPFARDWDDGSHAGYGPEGGTGPNELAYVRIEGQDCLYNVWSRLGREHLETLLSELRFVQTE